MSEFNYRSKSLSVRAFQPDHVTATLSTVYGRDERTVVTVAHFPQTAEDAEQQCDEFYSLEISLRGNNYPYSNSTISAHLTREDIERLHNATGGLLALTDGAERGAAHSRVSLDPQDEIKYCENCKENERAEGFDTCQCPA